MNNYTGWNVCDICGHEGMCRKATGQEESLYGGLEDICERCDIADSNHKEREQFIALLVKIRDSGQWSNSALEMEYNVDGEQLLKEIEAIVGAKP